MNFAEHRQIRFDLVPDMRVIPIDELDFLDVEFLQNLFTVVCERPARCVVRRPNTK